MSEAAEKSEQHHYETPSKYNSPNEAVCVLTRLKAHSIQTDGQRSGLCGAVCLLVVWCT